MNKSDTLVIAPLQFGDGLHPVRFHLWNFKDKTFHNVIPHIKIEGTVIEITNWQREGEIAFWLNSLNKVCVFVYNIFTKEESEPSLKMYGNQKFIITCVSEVNFLKERILLNTIPNEEENCLDIINPVKNTFAFR